MSDVHEPSDEPQAPAPPPPAQPYVPPASYPPPPPAGGPQPGYPEPAYGPVGPQPMTPSDERLWAMLSHLGGLLLGFIAPLIVMLVFGERSPFVRRHAVESLNFQISLLIYSLVGGVLAFLFVLMTVGLGMLVVLPLALALAVAVLALIIIATVKAGNGEDYRYPFTIRFVS